MRRRIGRPCRPRPGTFSELQPQIAEIVRRSSKIPFDEIGARPALDAAGANAAIAQLHARRGSQKALAEVQRTTRARRAPQATLDSRRAQQRSTATSPTRTRRCSAASSETLLELQRAARALRVLADYLQQHPESLLRGKPADPALPTGPKR